MVSRETWRTDCDCSSRRSRSWHQNSKSSGGAAGLSWLLKLSSAPPSSALSRACRVKARPPPVTSASPPRTVTVVRLRSPSTKKRFRKGHRKLAGGVDRAKKYVADGMPGLLPAIPGIHHGGDPADPPGHGHGRAGGD